MRLITYDRAGARRLGAWVGETVVDLPEAVGHPAFPPTMEALVQHIGGSILEAAHDVLDDGEIAGECIVAKPRLLPAIVPSPKPMALVNEQGEASALEAGCFAAGLACIVGGASRARRMSRHEPRIFGYTLMAHWSDENKASATSLGPCVVTPDHLNEAPIELHLRIEGDPQGMKTLEAPNEFFGRVMAENAHRHLFEAGDVVALAGWTIGGRKAHANAPPEVVEVWAQQVGVLRAERPPK